MVTMGMRRDSKWDGHLQRRPQESPASTKNAPEKPLRGHCRGGGHCGRIWACLDACFAHVSKKCWGGRPSPIQPATAGDHKGPPRVPSSTLAPTENESYDARSSLFEETLSYTFSSFSAHSSHVGRVMRCGMNGLSICSNTAAAITSAVLCNGMVRISPCAASSRWPAVSMPRTAARAPP